jgi:amino acid permease
MAIIIPNINQVFSLIGSICSSVICYILPGLFYMKVMKNLPFSKKKLGAILLISCGSIIGVFSTVISIFQFSSPQPASSICE